MSNLKPSLFNFPHQAVILLSAQAPKHSSELEAYSKNIHSLINTFNKYALKQKIIVLGDQNMIDETLLLQSSWLLAYNSAYEQPITTSIHRGISLLKGSIESTIVWPSNHILSQPIHVEQLLTLQQQYLTCTIRHVEAPFPICIPRAQFSHWLSLHDALDPKGIKTDIDFHPI